MSPFKEKEAYFRRMLDVANVNALSPKERATYDENLKIYRDWKATRWKQKVKQKVSVWLPYAMLVT
jgi:hypothetical protein